MKSRNEWAARRSQGRAGIVLGLGAVMALAGCDSLLEVSLPGSTPAEAMKDPANAELLVVSTQGDFEGALNTFTFNAGHIGGELIGGQSALAAIPFQRRDVRSLDTQNDGLYNSLSTARWTAENVYKLMEGATDVQVANRARLMGRAALYAGFSYTVFGEGFCRVAFDLGPAELPPAIFARAEARFTSAIGHATQSSDTETLNSAYVGRARVRLWLGNTAGALADARLVQSGFSKTVTRSTTRTNTIYVQNVRARSASIDPKYWTTMWQGVADPRVRVTNSNSIALDGLTPLYLQTKYPTDATPIRLASHTEARLIMAEVVGGAEAVSIINALHTAAGIPPFTGTTPTEIRNQVIEERRREFFLEGRRMGDLRRFGGFEQWTYGKNPFVGNEYGQTRCFPLPDSEVTANPNVDATDGRT